MVPPFLLVRLVATMAAVGFTVGLNLFSPSAQAKNHVGPAPSQSKASSASSAPTASTDRDQHRPSKVLNEHGLPAEELSYLIDTHKPAVARKLLNSTPKHPGDEEERKLWLAACLAREQRFEESLEQFEKIKSLQKAPTSVLLMAGSAYAENQQYAKAIAIASSILAKENNWLAYELRAGCYAASGKLIESSRDYEKCASLYNHASVSFLVKAAMILNMADKPKQALDIIERAIKTPSGKKSTIVYLAQADCYKKQCRWQEAVNSLTEALKYSKSYSENAQNGGNILLPACYKERAFCYQKLGNKALAQADLDALDKYSRGIANEMGAN